MNVSWLSSTALQADLTSANMLLQSEAFVNSSIASEATFAKTKDVISPFFSVSYLYCIFIIIIIKLYYYFDIILFCTGVYVRPLNCCVTTYVALGQKY